MHKVRRDKDTGQNPVKNYNLKERDSRERY